jgi:hypothetical protein
MLLEKLFNNKVLNTSIPRIPRLLRLLPIEGSVANYFPSLSPRAPVNPLRPFHYFIIIIIITLLALFILLPSFVIIIKEVLSIPMITLRNSKTVTALGIRPFCPCENTDMRLELFFTLVKSAPNYNHLRQHRR